MWMRGVFLEGDGDVYPDSKKSQEGDDTYLFGINFHQKGKGNNHSNSD